MECLCVFERNLSPWFLDPLMVATSLLFCFGEPDDIVTVHVFQEHLVDEAESQLTFQPLHMQIGFGSFGSIQFAGLVGVEPSGDCCMSCGESRTLLLLFFGRGAMSRFGESRDAYFAA